MRHTFTLEYWEEDDWLVGQLREVPSVFSQAKTLPELEANIQEVYELLFEDATLSDDALIRTKVHTKEIAVEV